MKIYFRYLLMRLVQMFAIMLAAMTLIWIMVDLYGNIDDFLENKANFILILRFYIWNIPKMLVLVLPAALLFSMLFTLLSLNRRSEMVAFQSGGMAPLVMFAPFLLFAMVCVVVLAYDMSGPSATAEVTRDRLLKQIKGVAAGRDDLVDHINVDSIHHRAYWVAKLNTRSGKATGMVVTDLDDQWQDVRTYSASEAQWTGESWQMSGGVAKIVYGPGNVPGQPKVFEMVDNDDDTTPRQLGLAQSDPVQLTVAQLEQYISTQSGSPKIDQYRTEWWYRVLFPFCLPVLMLFALRQGAQIDRRNTLAGVLLAIVVFIAFMLLTNVFMAVGRHGHLPPWLAVGLSEIIFGVVGLHLVALNNGWWWQVGQWWNRRRPGRAAAPPSSSS
jgi:lipopolysaccharide export system permease protein